MPRAIQKGHFYDCGPLFRLILGLLALIFNTNINDWLTPSGTIDEVARGQWAPLASSQSNAEEQNSVRLLGIRTWCPLGANPPWHCPATKSVCLPISQHPRNRTVLEIWWRPQNLCCQLPRHAKTGQPTTRQLEAGLSPAGRPTVG